MTAERRKTMDSEPKERANRGNAGKGRPKGASNKTTAALKDAILKAAEKVGEDGEGKGGLQGYLQLVARSDVKAFAGLLGKVLPLTVAGAGKDGAIIIQASSLDERL
jgi:hypothetical protein